jgi:EAL domain-containing protein (putative c-di-GMP-specific phosphodiesterase class I)/GGDEF domain-containing protein
MRETLASLFVTRAAAVAHWLRRPQLMVFLPAVTLAAFWLGGDRALLLVALGLPLIFAMAGAFRFAAPGEPVIDDPVGLRRHVLVALDRALRDEAATGRTTACIVLMFDDPAALLDRHGRAAQATIIQRTGERLCAVLRPGDTVARLEGGGFAVALSPVRRLDLETAIQIVGRLQAAVAEPLSIDAARLFVSCSAGFCLASRAPARTGAALLDAAQIAADEALRNGPGAIRAFQPDMARTRADRDAMRETLERALDEGQIRPHFQPQICADTGAITGFETLARWHHPLRGLLGPAEFLPAIADCGLSERLGEVMLFHALVALGRWEKAGLHVPRVGVNFSADELRNPRLPDRLRWELDRFDIAPERLSVEILETVVAQTDNDVIVRNVTALARMGCWIDLDDFGTGHTSITNLRRFAVRRLKIDRSFVTRVDEDPEQQRIVAAILSLAERLGLDTLAEGVETPGEQAILAQLGCGHLQGFAIGRPMSFDDTLDWMRRHATQVAALPRLTSGRARGGAG